MAIELSEQQLAGLTFVEQQLEAKTPLIAIAGPAGSGKTTMMRELGVRLEKFGIVFCAMTNKAALVLRSKGIEAGTLHQSCMRPILKAPYDKLQAFLEKAQTQRDNSKITVPADLEDEYTLNDLAKALDTTRTAGVCAALRGLGVKDIFKHVEGWKPEMPQPGILVVDEASMMGEIELAIAKKVYKWIILIGDTFQLGPIKSAPVFWEVPARFELTQIHRQAEGSQPLVMATKVRNDETLVPSPIKSIDIEAARHGTPVICYTNKTRISLVNSIRAKLGYKGLPPQAGESLICRNGPDRDAKNRGLINNTIWTVLDSSGFTCTLQNEQGDILEDEHVYIEELDDGHGIPFRFAYALTAHNAQGSEWPEVMIHVPDVRYYMGRNRQDALKWLYTAITRAKEKVHWVNRVAY